MTCARLDVTLIAWVLAELFVPLHRRKYILVLAVVGVFAHADCFAQNEGASPFNTVGYNYRKPRAIVEIKPHPQMSLKMQLMKMM